MTKRFIVLIICLFLGVAVSVIGYRFLYSEEMLMEDFSKYPLSDSLKSDMRKKKIWSSQCPVPLERLNILNVSYIDFEGNKHHNGNIIVLDVAADYVLAIFKKLYQQSFPIHSINLINEYDGDDTKSMADNNTSAFNCRIIADNSLLSIHSYGLAIDINPLQNPYLINKFSLGKTQVPIFPPEGMEYINRVKIRAGMVESIIDPVNNLNVVDLFKKNGFTIWGGQWMEPVDWHHFQVTRTQAETLAQLPYEEGVAFFKTITEGK